MQIHGRAKFGPAGRWDDVQAGRSGDGCRSSREAERAATPGLMFDDQFGHPVTNHGTPERPLHDQPQPVLFPQLEHV